MRCGGQDGDLAERTRQSADAAVAHVVDLLGSGPVALGQQIDWHADFKVGLGWPRDVLADDQDYLRLGEPCDVKVPWELSRCHHWVALGRAYALTGDARYAWLNRMICVARGARRAAAVELEVFSVL